MAGLIPILLVKWTPKFGMLVVQSRFRFAESTKIYLDAAHRKIAALWDLLVLRGSRFAADPAQVHS